MYSEPAKCTLRDKTALVPRLKVEGFQLKTMHCCWWNKTEFEALRKLYELSWTATKNVGLDVYCSGLLPSITAKFRSFLSLNHFLISEYAPLKVLKGKAGKMQEYSIVLVRVQQGHLPNTNSRPISMSGSDYFRRVHLVFHLSPSTNLAEIARCLTKSISSLLDIILPKLPCWHPLLCDYELCQWSKWRWCGPFPGWTL